MRQRVLYFIVSLITLCNAIVPAAFAVDTTPAFATSSYDVTWKLQYKASGVEGSQAAVGHDGYYDVSSKTASYEGMAKVTVNGNTTRTEALSTAAHFVSDSTHTQTPAPVAECGPGLATSHVTTQHWELTNPNAFMALDNNPPQIIKIQLGKNADDQNVIRYPLQNNSQLYTYSLLTHMTTHFCDGTESSLDLPSTTSMSGDGSWSAWNGLPACVRGDLISHNGVYTNHCEIKVTAPNGPNTIQPYSEEYIVDITVVSNNEAPKVDAGADAEGGVGTAVPLNGTVTDDGLPSPPAQVTSTWSVESKPAGSNVRFDDVHMPATTATFDKPGDYTLKLTATDGEKEAFDTVAIRINGFSILTPTEGAQLDKHLEQVEPGTVNFSWTNVPDASEYILTLRDKNTGGYLMKNKGMGKETSFSMSNNDFKYGHEYEATAKAVTPKQTLEDKHTFKIKVLPDITDPLTQQLHDGQIVWTNTTSGLIAARDTFAQLLQAKHWSIRYTSAYRTLYYQEHLYLIVENLKDKNLSSADRAFLLQEKAQHGLGTVVAKPNPNAPHVQGIAFDANIFDEHNQPLNGKTWINAELEKMALQAGFKKPPHGDDVHFQLR